MGYIYLITNTVNGKKYVGQTLEKDINTRWKQHKNQEKNTLGRYLSNAYIKYGIKSFKFQIICVTFDDACNELEEFYIQKYNSLVPNGYNLKAGGKNSKHHPDTIKKMSDTLKGRVLGVKTEETSRKLRETHLGEKNPNFGKKMSDEQKKKISDTHKKLWQENPDRIDNISIEKRANQLEGLKKGHEVQRKKVGKYDIKGNLLKIYNSTVEASENENICRMSIGKVCRGAKSYKTAGGFVWRYLPKDYTIQ
jgi:group I intron endonuclease